MAWTKQTHAAAVAAGAFGDLDRDLPHVRNRARMHAVRAHTGRLPLAAVDAALGGFQGNVAAEGSRANDGATNLGANGSGDHARADRSGRARGRSSGGTRRVEGIGCRWRM